VHRANLGLFHDLVVPKAGNGRGDIQKESARYLGLGSVGPIFVTS
jgi:hypothetical protein